MPGIGIGIGIGIGFRNIPPDPKFKFDMLENGLDFITEAVETINASTSHRRLKYAVIHLCSGVELVFKEVLRNKDWRLIFQEKNEATPELLQSGDFESVRLKKAIKLVESECKVKFTDEDKKVLEDLRLKRNKIEHFKVDERVSALKSLSAKVLNFLIQFIDSYVNVDQISNLSKGYIKNLPKELTKFNTYVAERNQGIKTRYDQKINKGIIVVNCPNCLQKALFVDSQLKCMFCNYTNSPEILAFEINKTFNNTHLIPQNKCTNCSSISLISSDEKTICLSCGQQIEKLKQNTNPTG